MKTGKKMNLTANKNNVMKNSNHTEKENKTMRNTLKIRTRILAGLLAAATTVSAFTAVGTTAFAEEAVCVEEAVAEEAGTVEAAACDQFIEEPAADAFAGQDTAVAAEEFVTVDVACDEAQETFVDGTGEQVIEVEAVFDVPADAGCEEGAAVEEGVEVDVEAAEEVAGAIRFSFGAFNTEEEMPVVVDKLKRAVSGFRKLGSFR